MHKGEDTAQDTCPGYSEFFIFSVLCRRRSDHGAAADNRVEGHLYG